MSIETICCPLGAIPYKERERLLYETDNFFVAATLGPMGIQGYLLVVSKDHYIGTGDIEPDLHRELADLVDTTKRIVTAYFQPPMIFEHGPRVCASRGGSCLDHAHVHVVPSRSIMDILAVDLLRRLDINGQFYRVDRLAKTEALERAAQIYRERKTSHLYVEDPTGLQVITEINFQFPSQYLRRMIAAAQCKSQWNWREHPDTETILLTVAALKGKF